MGNRFAPYRVAGAHRQNLELVGNAVVITNVSEVVFKNLTANYIAYLLVMDDFIPATDSERMTMEFSTDNGSTYLASSSYKYAINGYTATGGALTSNGDSSNSIRITHGNQGSGGDEEGHAEIWIGCPMNDQVTMVHGQVTYHDTSTNLHSTRIGGRTSAGQHNAFKVSYTNNVARGAFALYGTRERLRDDS